MSSPDEKRKAIETQADWERVLAAAAHIQSIVPDAHDKIFCDEITE